MNKIINPLIPTCHLCHVAMKQGIAIGPTDPDWLKHSLSDPGGHLINNETITLEDVWKCPQCGHSMDMPRL